VKKFGCLEKFHTPNFIFQAKLFFIDGQINEIATNKAVKNSFIIYFFNKGKRSPIKEVEPVFADG